EVHVPFGGDAVRRVGHPLPQETRAAGREADAVLVASTQEPALEGVMADLDLTWRVTRVRLRPAADLAVVSPLTGADEEWAIERAFDLACSRRAKVTSVASSTAWPAAVERVAGRFDGVLVEHVPVESVLPVLHRDPARFDVLAAEQPFAEALSRTAAFAHDGARMVASGRLSPRGPGVFGPTHGSAPDIAGQGVANPSGMLLAAALMLGEGLGQRAAARTLEEALAGTLGNGVRTPDLVRSGAGATTREFTDVLIAALPGARMDTELRSVLS
ncbi:MAG: isocitrate/isopropylmalate family dehydrogenase, partial [Gaiellaceae bacterium]